MAQMQNTSPSRGSSWGSAAGLLAGCGVTLAGVALDLPPLTILWRSIVAGCVVAALATVFSVGWQLVTPPPEEE